MTSWAPSGGDAGDLLETFPCREPARDAPCEAVLAQGAGIRLATPARTGCQPALPGPLLPADRCGRGRQGGQ
jgi:hypothetical protein